MGPLKRLVHKKGDIGELFYGTGQWHQAYQADKNEQQLATASGDCFQTRHDDSSQGFATNSFTLAVS